MTLKDWVELVLLVLLTLSNGTRWMTTREHTEADTSKEVDKLRSDHGAALDRCRTDWIADCARIRGDLQGMRVEAVEEHKKIWAEIDRNRAHWHEDMVPFQQKMLGEIARLTERIRGHGAQIAQVWTALDRRREGR